MTEIAATAVDALLRRRARRDRQDSAIAQLVEALGGREAILPVLQAIPADDPAYPFASKLCDPRAEHLPIGQLCRRAKLAVRDLLVAYNRGQELLTQARVAAIAARTIDAVATDVMTRAAPHYATCGTCKGDGHVFNKPDEKCEVCRGTGEVYVLPDLGRQRTALELAKVAAVTGSTQVTVDARRQLAIFPSEDSFAKLQTAVDRIIRAPRVLRPVDVVDADVAPGDAPE